MGYLTKIQAELAPELKEMNKLIDDVLATRHELINTVVQNYLIVKGKQIRPIVVMLSARMFGAMNRDVIYACAALEMLHNASLIHDDVIDETKLRRGLATMNAQWGNLLAVLVGDYFISNALRTGLMTGNLTIIGALSDLGKELSVGEIDQACNVRDHNIDEDSYFGMIGKKTAALFVNCVRIGAEAVGAKPEEYAPLVRYAELLGLCFQIKDDIFDYFDDEARIGKPTGNDLREGKVTLPLIYALETAPDAEAAPMRELVMLDRPTDEQIRRLVDFAKAQGGIDYAFRRMRAMQAEAREIIAVYPDSPWKRHFEDIFEFIISRDI